MDVQERQPSRAKAVGDLVVRPVNALRGVISASVAVGGAVFRFIWLKAHRLAGTLARWSSRGWLTAAAVFLAVLGVLTGVPPLFDLLARIANRAGVWSTLGLAQPHADDWLTPWSLLGAFAAAMLVLWMIQARRRVVIEDFVDYTSDAAKAVSGLSTLLVAELGRLRSLYKHVNEELSVSRSVGVTKTGGVGAVPEPGSFLTVRADDISEVLAGAVASEGELQIGLFKIPLGTLFSIFGRLFKGPRLIGSVHLTEAGGGPMLTAQIVGRGSSHAWRVDLPESARSGLTNAFLEPMVSELACRMFNDLTLRGSVRWKAIDHFITYLRLYSESRRTPKYRASYLRQAERALMNAVSEDSDFDLAFYNLGVIYLQLAEAERRGAAVGTLGEPGQLDHDGPASEDGDGNGSDPDRSNDARRQAALAAFERALDVKPGQPDVMYALAVLRFSCIDLDRLDDGLEDLSTKLDSSLADTLRSDLEHVVQTCSEVVNLDHRHAQAFDLRGLANRSLGKLARRQGDESLAREWLLDSMRDHRAAVRKAWRRLCQAEFSEKAHPPTSESVLPERRANASAAFRNLAVAYHLRGDMRKAGWHGLGARRWLLFWRSDFTFMQALKLAPATTLAATQFGRGLMRTDWDVPRLALKSFAAAAKLDSEHPLYRAHLAHAYALRGRPGDEAKRLAQANRALDKLTPIYRRSLEACPPPEKVRLRDKTLRVLAEVCRSGAGCRISVPRLQNLITDLQTTDLETLQRLDSDAESDWERVQIRLARARLLEHDGDLQAARDLYSDGLVVSQARRDDTVSMPLLHARRAKLMRRLSRAVEEPARAELLQGALSEAAAGLMKNPLNPAVRREVGKDHFELEQYADALDVWNQTLALTPNDPHLNFKLGLCHWHLAEDRRDTQARAAALAEAWNRFDTARLLFGLERIEGWTWSQLWRGRVALDRGDLDAAVPDLRSASSFHFSKLAAMLLLGEAHRRAGEEALSQGCFQYVFDELEQATGTPHLDHGHGNTVTHYEALAWAGWALASSPAATGTTVDERLAKLSQAKAAAQAIPQPRNRTIWLAKCWDAEGLLLVKKDLKRAVEALEQAGGLVPSPEIILHLIELYEAQAIRSTDRKQRLELIHQAERTMRKLKRLGAYDHDPDAADAGQVLARLQSLTQNERSLASRRKQAAHN